MNLRISQYKSFNLNQKEREKEKKRLKITKKRKRKRKLDCEPVWTYLLKGLICM